MGKPQHCWGDKAKTRQVFGGKEISAWFAAILIRTILWVRISSGSWTLLPSGAGHRCLCVSPQLGRSASLPLRSSSAATSHCTWRFWRDGIEFVFHLSCFRPTRFDWEQALLLPPVRGMALPEKRVCSLLPHALACQLFPILLTCRALGQAYWGSVWPRREENKSIWSQGQSAVLASELCLTLCCVSSFLLTSPLLTLVGMWAAHTLSAMFLHDRPCSAIPDNLVWILDLLSGLEFPNCHLVCSILDPLLSDLLSPCHSLFPIQREQVRANKLKAMSIVWKEPELCNPADLDLNPSSATSLPWGARYITYPHSSSSSFIGKVTKTLALSHCHRGILHVVSNTWLWLSIRGLDR